MIALDIEYKETSKAWCVLEPYREHLNSDKARQDKKLTHPRIDFETGPQKSTYYLLPTWETTKHGTNNAHRNSTANRPITTAAASESGFTTVSVNGTSTMSDHGMVLLFSSSPARVPERTTCPNNPRQARQNTRDTNPAACDATKVMGERTRVF